MNQSNFPEALNMGGFRTILHSDQYPDGRPCFVAGHPDIPDCVAYAETPQLALQHLESARVLIAQLDKVSQRPASTVSKSAGNTLRELQVA